MTFDLTSVPPALAAGGDMLAIGAQTGSIYPYKVGRDGAVYVKFGPMQGTQPLTQLDWSVDGEYMRTVTSQHELIICEWALTGNGSGSGT